MCTVWYMTHTTSPVSPGRLAAVAALAAALLVPATAGAATSAPTVEVAVGDHAITLAGAGHVRPGPVRLHLSGDSLGEPRTIAVVALARGSDPAAGDLDALRRAGRLVAGANLSAGNDYATTITARGHSYAIVDVTSADGGQARFAVAGRNSGARPPRSDASIAIRDHGFDLPSALPADGVLRIANRGARLHEVTAFRLPASTSVAEARRIVIRGGSFARLGTATTLNGLVAPGVVNRVEAHLRRGRYLVASLYAPPTREGRPDVLRGLVASTRVR